MQSTKQRQQQVEGHHWHNYWRNFSLLKPILLLSSEILMKITKELNNLYCTQVFYFVNISFASFPKIKQKNYSTSQVELNFLSIDLYRPYKTDS